MNEMDAVNNLHVCADLVSKEGQEMFASFIVLLLFLMFVMVLLLIATFIKDFWLNKS